MKELAARPKDETPSRRAGHIAIDPALPCEPVRLLSDEETATVARLRGGVGVLRLLDPQEVPGPRDASGRWTAPARQAGASPRHDGRAEALDTAHDRYFRMERAPNAGSADAFAATLAASLGILAFEFGNEAISPGYDLIARAIHAVLVRLGDAATFEPGAPSDEVRAVEPFGRWIRGHQIFAVLTQGLIHAFLDLEAAMEQPGDDAAASLLMIAALLSASAVSLRLTGAFDPDTYQRLVRPSMAPPHVPHGFSGLLSADHRHLVQTMLRLRPCLAESETRFPAAHAAMQAALASVYDTHKHVCARFAGESTPSLRMKAASARSGVEQLENFKRARLRLVSAGASATV